MTPTPTLARRFTLAAGLAALLAAPAGAQTIAPAFAGSYSVTSLGTPTGVPGSLGGLTLKAGDPNTLLIGGNANLASGAIYQIGVTRDGGGHITGFSGSASVYATAQFIDGGLAYGPGGVLFATTYSNNSLLQYKPGSTAPDKTISLTTPGVATSTGTVAFVPAGFAGAGGIRFTSYTSGKLYSGSLTADGSGTYDLSGVAQIPVSPALSGPEGIAWVPTGSPVFGATPSLLVSEYNAGTVAAYSLDGSGNPIAGSRQVFLSGLTGAEGAFIDPLTGDFLLSTYGGGNKVLVVQGFAPVIVVPEPAGLVAVGLALVAVVRRRRPGPAGSGGRAGEPGLGGEASNFKSIFS